MRTSRRVFAALDADLAVVAAYGLILPKPILEAPEAGLHQRPRLAPAPLAGAAPIQRAILAGDEVTGMTLMQMEEGLDTGPMLLTRELPTSTARMLAQLTEELAKLGAAHARRSGLASRRSPEAAARRRVRPMHRKIDKTESTDRLVSNRRVEIERQVRAFSLAPGAWFEVNGERIKAT